MFVVWIGQQSTVRAYMEYRVYRDLLAIEVLRILLDNLDAGFKASRLPKLRLKEAGHNKHRRRQ